MMFRPLNVASGARNATEQCLSITLDVLSTGKSTYLLNVKVRHNSNVGAALSTLHHLSSTKTYKPEGAHYNRDLEHLAVHHILCQHPTPPGS